MTGGGSEKLISVVLPVYNGERYLAESIDSVLGQTYRNWELLILDDASSDCTPQIAKSYAARDARIFYYRNERNLRLPANLNRGFSLARGDLFTWTSDDNRFLPSALEKMASELEREGGDFAIASCRIINEEGEGIEFAMVDESSGARMVGLNPVCACFLYTRRAAEAVGGYDPAFTLVEDYDYWQRLYTSFGMVTLPEILYEYRYHLASLTSTADKNKFNRTLEAMLRKNRPLFGDLTFAQTSYYYTGLYRCRANRGRRVNRYSLPYTFFFLWNLLRYRVPGKIKRELRARSAARGAGKGGS